MKIKSTVLQVLAAASLGAGLLYAMGIEGGPSWAARSPTASSPPPWCSFWQPLP